MIQIHKSFLYLYYNVRDAACGHRGGLYTLRCPRITKLLRYCRIMRMIHRNAEAWTPRQGEIELWMASFDGFVLLWKPIRHNSYSILAAQCSGHRSVCSPTRCPQAASRTTITTILQSQWSNIPHSRGLPAESAVRPSLLLLCRQPVFRHTRVNSVSSHNHPVQMEQNKYFSYSSAFRYS